MSIDLEKGFEFMDKELDQEFPSGDENYEQKVVDKLIRLHTKEGKSILLHLEVQDKYSKNFSQRMYNYFNRLYDKYRIPITAYAIFTEPNVIKRADTFNVDYMGTSLSYRFNTFKIADQDNDYLTQHSNPFALIILIAKATALRTKYKIKQVYDDRLLSYKLEIAKLIRDRKLSEHKERTIMNFLLFYINFELKETNINFENKLNPISDINNMTIEEVLLEDAKRTGFLEGRNQAKENEVYRRIVKEGLTDRQIAKFAEVSLYFVKKIRAKIQG